MCEPPLRFKFSDSPDEFNERPPGLAAGTVGTVWVLKDTPMLLHIFEYITREVLKAWWSSWV